MYEWTIPFTLCICTRSYSDFGSPWMSSVFVTGGNSIKSSTSYLRDVKQFHHRVDPIVQCTIIWLVWQHRITDILDKWKCVQLKWITLTGEGSSLNLGFSSVYSSSICLLHVKYKIYRLPWQMICFECLYGSMKSNFIICYLSGESGRHVQ